jgi:hypothetical protein
MEEDLGGRQRQVLSDLRSARRRHRIAEFDPFEALYRAYLTGIVLAVAVLVLSGLTGDGKLSVAEVARVRHHGGAAVGLAVGLMFAIGLRSGGRGGPLVIEAADVRHVLLAPVDRSLALRGPAIRQLRFACLLGGGAGAVAGLLAFRRLPGAPAAWVAAGTVVGALAVAGAFGLAMLMSGLRLGRWVGGGLAVAVLAWSGLDLALGTTTSPASLLGQLALWPLAVHPVDVVGALFALAALASGLALVGGASLEASERRAALVGQIRFAATLQDLRTVIVLRRQLAQELPRQRPWFRLPRSIPKAWLQTSPAGRTGRLEPRLMNNGKPVPHRRPFPVWRRGWHGILRWPALRFARVGVLGGIAGVSLYGVWKGTTPLLVIAGLALYIAGLDAVEPLAQEVDHPDRLEEFDLPGGRLHLRQLAASAVLMILVGAAGVGAAAAVTGGAAETWQVGAVMLVPAALTALGAAAVSVIKGPPPPLSPQQTIMPEAAGARAMGRLLWPPIISVLGVLPVLAARDAARHGKPIVAATAAAEQLVVLLVAGLVAWVRWQEEAHAWFDQQMETAKRGGPAAGPSDQPK